MSTGRTNKQGGATVSLTGDAVVANVLSGKTFYNTDPNTKLTGTMTNKVGSATVFTPTTTDVAITAGYYGGAVGDGKVTGDADLVAGNIKNGVDIFGVTGTYASGGNWTAPTYSSGILSATALVNVNYSGSGVAYCENSYSYGFGQIFFHTSLVTNGSGNVTIDGVTLNAQFKLHGYSINQTIWKYNAGNMVSNINNLNYSGNGVAYIDITAVNYGFIAIFFHTSLVTNGSGNVTIDGVAISTSLKLCGYSIPF